MRKGKIGIILSIIASILSILRQERSYRNWMVNLYSMAGRPTMPPVDPYVITVGNGADPL